MATEVQKAYMRGYAKGRAFQKKQEFKIKPAHTLPLRHSFSIQDYAQEMATKKIEELTSKTLALDSAVNRTFTAVDEFDIEEQPTTSVLSRVFTFFRNGLSL